jgi:hypothetical protein
MLHTVMMLTENQSFWRTRRKDEVYSAMAVLILLHGSEFWTVNIIKEWMTIQAAGMKCWTSVKLCRTNRIINGDIKTELGNFLLDQR